MNSSASGNLRVGVAKVDITPEDLTNLNPLGGSFTGVHDPIHLRALVLDDGAHEVALLSADLIEAGDMTPVRERIERELGIPFDHIVITATHTHSAPGSAWCPRGRSRTGDLRSRTPTPPGCTTG